MVFLLGLCIESVDKVLMLVFESCCERFSLLLVQVRSLLGFLELELQLLNLLVFCLFKRIVLVLMLLVLLLEYFLLVFVSLARGYRCERRECKPMGLSFALQLLLELSNCTSTHLLLLRFEATHLLFMRGLELA